MGDENKLQTFQTSIVIMLSRAVRIPTRRALVVAPRAPALAPMWQSVQEVRCLSSEAKAKRPISPHLSIYRVGVNMVASVMFRGTGMAMTAGALFNLLYFHGFCGSPSSGGRW